MLDQSLLALASCQASFPPWWKFCLIRRLFASGSRVLIRRSAPAAKPPFCQILTLITFSLSRAEVAATVARSRHSSLLKTANVFATVSALSPQIYI